MLHYRIAITYIRHLQHSLDYSPTAAMPANNFDAVMTSQSYLMSADPQQPQAIVWSNESLRRRTSNAANKH